MKNRGLWVVPRLGRGRTLNGVNRNAHFKSLLVKKRGILPPCCFNEHLSKSFEHLCEPDSEPLPRSIESGVIVRGKEVAAIDVEEQMCQPLRFVR